MKKCIILFFFQSPSSPTLPLPLPPSSHCHSLWEWSIYYINGGRGGEEREGVGGARLEAGSNGEKESRALLHLSEWKWGDLMEE